jgi:hypothetical protein
MKPINTLLVKCKVSELLNVKKDGTCSYHWVIINGMFYW